MIQRIALALVLASGYASADASESARELLARMNHALATREYDGVLLYLHDGQVETLRVVRAYENGMPVSRVSALGGSPRALECARHARLCTLPDGSQSRLQRESMQYLTAAAASLRQVPDSLYELRLAGDDQVAGLHADVVEAVPRDRMRFGFRVWIAQQTGMMLGSSRLRPDGRPLEQMMFTRIRVGGEHSPVMLDPLPLGAPSGAVRAQGLARDEVPSVKLPAGFALIGAGAGPVPASRHFLYSDGLASVSLYLEPASGNAPAVPGVMRRGAIHVLARRGPALNALVMGDVPAATLQTIAASLDLD